MSPSIAPALPTLLEYFASRGWPLSDLAGFRMEEGEGSGDGGEGGASEGETGAAGTGATGEGAASGEGGASEGETGTKSKKLEDLLDSIAAEDRKAILDQVASARKEAKGLRDRLKAVEPKAAEYDKLEAASKSETDRAKESVRVAEEKAADMRERIAGAEIKAALAGIVPDPASIVSDLNLSRFVTDEGDVDTDAVEELREKYAAMVPAGQRAPKPNHAQGANGGQQQERTITRDDLGKLSVDEINKLRKEGKLDGLMGKRLSSTTK